MKSEQPWLQTQKCPKVHLLIPRAEEIKLEDIANGLANKARYNGHSGAFYSVAQHSVYVAAALPPHLRVHGLLHDAHEVYTGDIISPMKDYFRLQVSRVITIDYRAWQAMWMAEIWKRFGLNPPTAAEADMIREKDLGLRVMEMTCFYENLTPGGYPVGVSRFEITDSILGAHWSEYIDPWHPGFAKVQWMNAWYLCRDGEST